MHIEFSQSFTDNPGVSPKAVLRTLDTLAGAAKRISALCARGPLEGNLAAVTGIENADGDQQKALDIRSDEIIVEMLQSAPVAYYASEERDNVMTLDPSRALAVACDPLDGSANIDANVSIGTIFSVYPVAGNPEGSFFRPGSEQLAAGFFVYGPQTSLVMTSGADTQTYVLDRNTNVFRPAMENMRIPVNSREYAINASNHHHWCPPVRRYIDDCLRGESGPLGCKQNMRWVGSLVADANRILMRGGVFLYPDDDRKGYEEGRLRLIYEGNPVAFVIEQAGGQATDGCGRILDIVPHKLHQRVPLVFGSGHPVTTIRAYHEKEKVIA